MITTRTISRRPREKTFQRQLLDNIELHDSQRAYFFQEVIEGLQDGILLLNETGELIHANTSACSIVSEINQDSSNSNCIPPAIWCLCETLLENRSIIAKKTMIISHEIVVDKSKVFSVRVRWLNLEKCNSSYLLVSMENKYESLKNLAILEVAKYKLTPREAEIWYLYRRKLSYKEIAEQLYISMNTVKKHMRNIHAKRQAFLNCED
ncbi:MAG: helix-turn-helix transcriptional regulator [Brasilonema octagenarum HA4186-MV1]|jgi:DNA-binding CsgD family transcriptional regulator|uniref:Helix-turn-helix transcriptional regulator n=3 Tax=Scytonemataceae TaxID=1182 RepID=A0A856MPU9_9CYAN|nr:helix-turn-helix transcriptional regulator [Brasilonema octagenarum HA4186-MV1]NMF66875.1 helix-turn-helix transcriptional regulator [Brasilonema octagenarum UFV-OR1]QDL11026.1 helix-turn-helix transcriptional regulator [Brasilonema sennae CENA114]QDL18832.1 helix-turn-helix transcriptional regulator [Brasilonema octagenarum UFV-E1]